MLVPLPFSLFCSSWTLRKLGRTEISFKISSISPPSFVPDSRLCRVEADFQCNLLYLYARLEPKSFYSSISCSAGYLTCFSSKTKLLRALPFPLSPSSSSSVVLCRDARLPWSDCWIISSDRGYNRSNHQPPQFPSLRLVLNCPQFSSFQLFGGPVWWSQSLFLKNKQDADQTHH